MSTNSSPKKKSITLSDEYHSNLHHYRIKNPPPPKEAGLSCISLTVERGDDKSSSEVAPVDAGGTIK
jgi:hypothetical protein